MFTKTTIRAAALIAALSIAGAAQAQTFTFPTLTWPEGPAVTKTSAKAPAASVTIRRTANR